ncbi:glycosyltransferase [Granulicella tundricola]|uniref:Glycosyltransferase, MGT family n=1 Tax=Granulicella tundricola (strain ATCC BAA-1859 / DSM 23138 / MP5ACTX9) TaxID=1198114 RepID=E8X5V0_GRATM|nr:nucleotide disphospho-sugar-binding domain-containing protein [Granulicella tundricola]ADW70834.1 glycosyltransferase, MGT family [Granulicella tundricola MP5ACTX9]
MARFGAFCFPGTGHLYPMTALARSLQLRGHEVVIFGIADTEATVRAAGIEFCQIGAEDYPPGTLKMLDEHLARLKGIAAFRFTLARIRNSTRMILRDGPQAVRLANVETLLVDEAEFAGNVADHLGLSWISIALLPPLLPDDRFPPFWFGWSAGQDRLSRFRNRLAIRFLLRIASPIFNEVNQQRIEWGLKPLTNPEDGLSPIAQITQLPQALEFEISGKNPVGLYYTGPFLHAQQRPPVDFPWERLDGRPIIYASMGTLQNGSESIFKTITDACAGLDAQLVISLGGGLDPARLGKLAGDPLVVRFVPQLEILKRASLVITHAGINTVLESLSEGVPMVAIPLANDQPGVAARLRARGACVVVSRHTLNLARLRKAVLLVLEDGKYREAAQVLQKTIQTLNGPDRAADLIEQVLHIRPTQLNP